MRLYGHRGSICTNRVLFVFGEKAIAPEFVAVDLAAGEHRLPAHLTRQPFGMIPVLEDGAFSLYESRAIMRYLDRVLDGPALTPREPRTLAAMEQWISVEQSYLSPPVGAILQHKFLAPMRGETIDADALDRARAEAARALDVLDAALARDAYLAGDAFTLAEVSTAPVIAMLFVTGEDALVTRRRHVAAWWDRVSSRPGQALWAA
jgi:glutathione S-transferase